MEKHNVLSAARNIDLEAECLFRYVLGEEDIFYPHSHEYYEIFITVLGTVNHYINGITQCLPEGSLVFIRPGDIHGYRYDSPKSEKTAYINLTFTKETAELLFDYLFDQSKKGNLLFCDMPPMVILSSTEKERLVMQISELNVADWKNKSDLKMRMRVILADIFARHFYNYTPPSEEKSQIPLWLSKLISDMERPENFIGGSERMVKLSK